MSSIHLIHGFIGFGKTTIAKKLEQELPAVRFTHDEIMLSRYGRNPDDFQTKYKIVDEYIKEQTKMELTNGNSVILDYGFWNKAIRLTYYLWAKNLTQHVIFHNVMCDIDIARERAILRTKNNPEELFIDENIFNSLLSQYEPISEDEEYLIVNHNTDK